jgi:hypothetical protein
MVTNSCWKPSNIVLGGLVKYLFYILIINIQIAAQINMVSNTVQNLYQFHTYFNKKFVVYFCEILFNNSIKVTRSGATTIGLGCLFPLQLCKPNDRLVLWLYSCVHLLVLTSY